MALRSLLRQFGEDLSVYSNFFFIEPLQYLELSFARTCSRSTMFKQA